MSNLLLKKIHDLIIEKNSNIIISPDKPDCQFVLNLVDKIGPYIIGVKLHTDIFDPNDVNYLTTKIIKEKHNFIIIEDRKFADISSIVIKQVEHIKKWADIVTAHGIVGESMIAALDQMNIGILPIYQLSSVDNLIDEKYSRKVRDFSVKYKNVIGFITQSHVVDGLLNFSPGISLENNEFDFSSNHNTPQTMLNNGTDIFIIGRDIYEADNPIEMTKTYQLQCKKKNILGGNNIYLQTG